MVQIFETVLGGIEMTCPGDSPVGLVKLSMKRGRKFGFFNKLLTRGVRKICDMF